jgi:quercetin dioxygenase-like cupin family protein
MKTAKKSTQVPKHRHQKDDEWFRTPTGERFKIHISAEETEGRFTMLEMVADPRNRIPMHIHKNEHEHFIVLEGTLHIANGDKTLDAPAGTTVTVKKGVPHAWCNLSDSPLRLGIVFSPGHIEGMFREVLGRSMDDVAAILPKFGCLIVGPALLDGNH